MGKPLERQALDTLGKKWDRGKGTREKLLQNTREFARFVGEKYGLEKLENLKPKMVEAYIRDLQDRGKSASTLAGKMTALRELASAIGKQNIVPRANKDYGIERTRINPQVVDQDKIGQIRAALHARAGAGNKTAKMMVAADALRESFGLRAKESLMSKDIIEKGGKLYLVVEGAKGGRPRELAVDNEAKLRAVQMVAETSKALGSGTGRIIPPTMSLKEAYDAQRNDWKALGGTRENNANMHGERHAYARDLDEKGAPKAEIMADLGHGENRSPAAYGVK